MQKQLSLPLDRIWVSWLSSRFVLSFSLLQFWSLGQKWHQFCFLFFSRPRCAWRFTANGANQSHSENQSLSDKRRNLWTKWDVFVFDRGSSFCLQHAFCFLEHLALASTPYQCRADFSPHLCLLTWAWSWSYPPPPIHQAQTLIWTLCCL